MKERQEIISRTSSMASSGWVRDGLGFSGSHCWPDVAMQLTGPFLSAFQPSSPPALSPSWSLTHLPISDTTSRWH